MWHRLIQRGNAFFAKEWRIMAYQPVLYFFIWGASIRLAVNRSEPPNFDYISHDFYYIWLYLGVAGPLLALLSWHFVIHRSGKRRYIGMWLRLASDIMVFTNLLTFHIVNVATRSSISESKMFQRYIFGSVLLVCLLWIIRDLWTLFLTEKLAGRIHLGDDE
jgi:hypothetical protein